MLIRTLTRAAYNFLTMMPQAQRVKDDVFLIHPDSHFQILKDLQVFFSDDVEAIDQYTPDSELLVKALSMLEAARDWIDAVPSETVLPTMPGFDRDDLDALVARIQERIKS